MKSKSCQANYPQCQKTASFQHILKLGSMKIAKQWVCQNCQQIIEKEVNK